MNKKILTVFLISVVGMFASVAQSQNGISTYMNQNDMNDTFHKAAVLQRCSGLTLAYGAYLPVDMQDQKQLYGVYSQDLAVEAGVVLIQRGQETASSVMENVKESMLYYKDVYYEKIKKTQRDTGSIFAGEVGSDLKLCGSIYQQIKK